MSELPHVMDEHVAAAHLRIAVDRRTGRTTPAIIEELAQLGADPVSQRQRSASDPPPVFVVPATVEPEEPAAWGGTGSDVSPGGRGATAQVESVPRTAMVAQGGLTVQEQAVLDVIRAGLESDGYPPSVRQIGEAVGLKSNSSVAVILSRLERKGFLRRDPNRPRTVGVLPAETDPIPLADTEQGQQSASAPVYVPVIGRIAAGGPILLGEQQEDVFPLPREIVGAGDLFLLRVVGDSMVDAAIADGDWVVVRQQLITNTGELVAAMVDGEAVIRIIRRRDDRLWLVPQNPAYEPIDGEGATILGKVVAVLRRL